MLSEGLRTYASECILRSISSCNFIIETKAIDDLETFLKNWVSFGACGGIVYGRARIGKTRAMLHAEKSFKEIYGNDFPVIIWDITDHPSTERNFYASLLMAMGLTSPNKGATALILKERVLNALYIMAAETPFKRVVLFLDEAWKFDEKDFSWLMDLYNILNHKDIQLITFLFGTQELLDLRKSFKVAGKDQIIGRFMINEYHFYGIKSREELGLCLANMDLLKVPAMSGEEYADMPISQFYFPDAFRDGKASFYSLSNAYWTEFQIIRDQKGIYADDIPMKYFIDSFLICLKKYGDCGTNKVYFPTAKELYDSIIMSGFGESDDEQAKHRRKLNAE